MISSLKSLSTEVIFEIFDYLSAYDLFRSFKQLNARFNLLLSAYPLHLDFRLTPRIEFDYICSHLQPEQVYSLIFSDEMILHQVDIFQEYFPLFHEQFLHLQFLTFIVAFDQQILLPKSVRFLEIRKYDTYRNFGFDFNQVLEQQAEVLTYLKTDRLGLLSDINQPFPRLTHLIVDGGYHIDNDCYIAYSDQYRSIDAVSIFQRLQSPLTHLHLFIDQENPTMNIDLQVFSRSLTHLTLHFVEDMIVPLKSLLHSVINLHQITHLTVQANGRNDLIDGYQWERFLRQSNIRKFHFQFQIANESLPDESIILNPFRSSFWLKERLIYVGYVQNPAGVKTSVFTIPKFQLKYVLYPSSNFPYRTTAPFDIEQRIFYQSKIDELTVDLDQLLVSPTHRFTQVQSLQVHGSKLLSCDVLQTIMKFDQIVQLDIIDMEHFSRAELNKLIEYCPRLHKLTMKYHPLFVVPPQVHTLRLEEDDNKLIPINNLSHTIPHVKALEIPIRSEDMMLDIVDQFDHINEFLFSCDYFSQGCYLEFFIEKLRFFWLEENSYRLRMNEFTLRQGEEYQQVQISIGNPKTKD